MDVKWFTDCPVCGARASHTIRREDALELCRKDRRNIQDILWYITPQEREQFITGICPECWDEMYNGLEG